MPVDLTAEWKTCGLPLMEFAVTNMRILYVVAEFVFWGADSATCTCAMSDVCNVGHDIVSPCRCLNKMAPEGAHSAANKNVVRVLESMARSNTPDYYQGQNQPIGWIQGSEEDRIECLGDDYVTNVN